MGKFALKSSSKETVHALIMVLACAIAAVILLVLSTPNNPYAYYEKDYFDDNLQNSTDHIIRKQMLQLPDDVLMDIDTETLVTSVLNYPYFSDVFVFNDIYSGMDMVSDNFNGFAELNKREDAGDAILDEYVKISRSFSLSDKQSIEKKHTLIKLELLLSEEDIFSQLTAKEREKLLKNLNKNYDEENPQFYIFEQAKDFLREKLQ